MTAAVINPGEKSMPTETPAADLVIGVNRAATAHHCNVWACGDLPAVQRWSNACRGSPLLLTAANTVEELRKRGFAWRGPVVQFEEMFQTLHPSLVDWPFLTMLAAVVYAAHVGAEAINVYGADWSGTRDFDGVEAGANRSPARWAKERELFEALQTVLKWRGVRVERVRRVEVGA